MLGRSSPSAGVCCAIVFALFGCTEWAAPGIEPACPLEADPLPSHPTGFRVEGNQIVDTDGNRVVFRGVNRSGSEYRCIQGHGFFDGPDDEASVQAIASWNVTAVRVPLNEGCWLAVNDAPEEFSGCAYKQAIHRYVRLLHRYRLIPILDLHWVGPNGARADRLQPMPDAEHALDFWRDVARTFLDDPGVVFEPFNEPFPDGNRDTDAAWDCWRDGCVANQMVADTEPLQTYRAVGMQAIVSAIRGVGAPHLVLLGGVQYSNGLSQWLARKPNDPLNNLAAAWHVYTNNPCRDTDCWNTAPRELAATVPVVATEIGQNDCMGSFVLPLMDWLDEHGSGYLAWSWNAYGPCRPPSAMRRGSPWSLVTDYTSGTPNSEYASAVRDHLTQFAAP